MESQEEVKGDEEGKAKEGQKMEQGREKDKVEQMEVDQKGNNQEEAINIKEEVNEVNGEEKEEEKDKGQEEEKDKESGQGQQAQSASGQSNTSSCGLSLSELEILSQLDSSQFGFFSPSSASDERKKRVALKAISFLEQIVAVKVQNKKISSLDPKVYCKLGHLHLLFEDWPKALSAYSKFRSLSLERSDNDVLFLYGQGLVFFHYNAYHWATRTFQQAMYVDPGFVRVKEIYVRLGLMAKINGDFQTSLKYFQMAKRCDPKRESMFSPNEIQFHVAHLHEIHGKHKVAVEIYKHILSAGDALAPSLKADVHRQMGWTYYSVDGDLGDKQTRIQTAIGHLQKSIDIEPKSGHSLYLLGRCYAAIGKVHEAFIAYRNSVDKSESNADTWCSIGVLYQQQNQPMDALQAYICAVQLEKYHLAAWTNLGLLYENSNQLQDAVLCYTNAVSKQKNPSPNLHHRIKYMKTQLNTAPNPSTSLRGKQLPSVEEAWNLPVSNEMSGRQSNAMKISKEASKNKFKGDNPGGVPSQLPSGPAGPVPSLTQPQLQTLHFLQSQSHLSPQQQHILQQLQQQFHAYKQQQQNIKSETNPEDLLMQIQNKDLGSVSDKELEALINEQDIGSFAESLLKQIQGDTSTPMDFEEGDGAAADGKEDLEEKGSLVDVPTDLEYVRRRGHLKLTNSMSGEEISKACKKLFSSSANAIHCGANLSYNPDPPKPPEKPIVRLSKENLLPPTPSVYLENKKDAFSPQLQEFCVQHPITVVRGIAGALKLDLGLFSTKTLQESHKGHKIDVISHSKQNPDENWDQQGRQVWRASFSKSQTTIGKYAQYQTSTFHESLKEEQDKTGYRADLENDFREFEARKRRKHQTAIQFGTNADLSDQRLWRQQLTELMKLPSWARVVSAGNILSHIGYPIQGMNTVQLQMKVPGARTMAHQEPNNFCSIDINIGPGDCEWFAIPFDYWGAVKTLCENHSVNFFRGDWWPNMRDLMDEEIPVYRFLQRPGDLVWVNSGCIHWVQAVGWSNNIRWNVGPLTPRQYIVALERYNFNRLQNMRSVVPMIHLSWSLARNLKIQNEALFGALRKTLRESLKKFILTSEYVKSRNVEAKFHGRKKGEPAHDCSLCENEVFGVLFVRELDGRHSVYCLDCVKAASVDLKGFVCLEEFRENELIKVYDNFRLQPPQAGLHTSMPPIPTHHMPPHPHHATAASASASPSGAGTSSMFVAASAATALQTPNHVISSY